MHYERMLMNENLNHLVIEASKFIKVARFLIIFWAIFYVAMIILGGLGIATLGVAECGKGPKHMHVEGKAAAGE
jgi:hypothetical protein